MSVSLENWRVVASDYLVDEIGIIGDIAIQDALDQLGWSEDQLRVDRIQKFLRQLAINLPPDVDRKRLVLTLRDRMFELYR